MENEINSKIIGVVEKKTFNGNKLGVELESGETYYPFFQRLAMAENIGKTLIVGYSNGSKIEMVE